MDSTPLAILDGLLAIATIVFVGSMLFLFVYLIWLTLLADIRW